MSTITKERAQEIFLCNGPEPTASEERELARIALASLEAEPVAYIREARRADGFCFADGIHPTHRHQRLPLSTLQDGCYWVVTPLYAAPQSPVVPDEMPAHTGPREFGRPQAYIDDWNACRAAMLQGAEPVTTDYKLPEETGSSLQLRNLIRQRHAEWSQATFGDVGPVGPLKHLSKEALEAAAEPGDLSEWADMQFLLWDAQRRAGISDGEITAAMEEKLKVNIARQWPEPKDGEPRLHIKAAPQQEVK